MCECECVCVYVYLFIYLSRSLSYMSIASYKASFPQSANQCFLLKIPVSSIFLKTIQCSHLHLLPCRLFTFFVTCLRTKI